MPLLLFTPFCLFIALLVYLSFRAAFISGAFHLLLFLVDDNYSPSFSLTTFLLCFKDSLTERKITFSYIKERLWVALTLKLSSHKPYYETLAFISSLKNNNIN